MDRQTLIAKKHELLAQLQDLEVKERDAGLKNVAPSDVGHSGWKQPIFAAIQRLDPVAAGDPKLAFWFDIDKFGGTRPQRALMIRRFVNGMMVTGKGALPDRMLGDVAAVEKAVKAALKEAEELSISSNGRADALTQAQRSAAIERVEREKLERRLAELERLIASQQPPAAPPAAADEGAAAPSEPAEVISVDAPAAPAAELAGSFGPRVPVRDEMGEDMSADEAKARADAFAPKPKRGRGRPRKAR